MRTIRAPSAASHVTAALLLAVAACGSDSTGPVVTTVTVTASGQAVAVGQTLQLTATARDAGGNVMSGQQVAWSSGTEGVATVNASGLVTGVTTGTARITATIAGRSGGLNITVTPPPVSRVTVAPAAPSVEVNATVQLTATVRDASGTELTGRTVTWSSTNTAVATVDGAGLARGLSPGAVDITATSEGVSGSVPLTVNALPGSVVVTAVTPALLVEGQTATISGAGFSASTTGNTVTIDGVVAAVTSASATSLTITVPSAGCMPARDAVITVAAGGQTGSRTHPVRPAAFTNLPVGELTLLAGPGSLCVQFDASATSSSYVIGVQSVSATATSRTPVRVRGRTAGTGGPTLSNARMEAAPSGTALFDGAARARAARHELHGAAELEIRRQESELAPQLFAAARQRAAAAPAMSALRVPADAAVGDTIDVRVPGPGNLCTEFTTITTVVRHRGTRGIWVEDVANPAGGFSAADYASLGSMLDGEIWTTNTTYFGQPTDDDNNQRIVIVVTQEVNKRENLLGFVSSADFFPVDCTAANGGEYYYGIAPDPAGSAGRVYTVQDALLDWPPLIAHEFTHIIQLGRRLYTPGATSFASVWELEGQATFAQEVVGHAVTGNTIGQNYGFATAFNNPATEPYSWYISGFSDLAYWFGYSRLEDGTSVNVGNAPEQCGWLGRPSDTDDMGPCLGSRAVYGVAWSFLRWLSDQYGSSFSGGEAELHRTLVVDSRVGFETIAGVIGRPIDELLAHWAAALYTDDRYTGLDPRLGFSSWNVTGVFNALIEPARLTPRQRAFSSFTTDVTVIAGSSAYFVVSGASRPATSLSFLSQTDGPLPAAMRIWIVRTQ